MENNLCPYTKQALRIEKVYEDSNKVIYKFEKSSEKYEKSEIDKLTGEINKLETGVELSRHYFLRAATKAITHNKNNTDNQYPDLLIYAT